jgi:hypothetical protein
LTNPPDTKAYGIPELPSAGRTQEPALTETPSLGGDALLPCPFCGGRAVVTGWFSVNPLNKRPDWFVASCVFGCGRSSEEHSRENAAKAWNRRAALPRES